MKPILFFLLSMVCAFAPPAPSGKKEFPSLAPSSEQEEIIYGELLAEFDISHLNNFTAAELSKKGISLAFNTETTELIFSPKKINRKQLDMADSYNDKANIYYLQGDYEKAEIDYKKAIEIYERFDEIEFIITYTYENLAILYEHINDYENAGIFYKKALEICERELDEDNLRIAKLLGSLANTYSSQGNYLITQGKYKEANDLYKEARELFVRSLRIFIKEEGLESFNTAITYHNLALLSERQEKHEIAIDYYKKTIEIYKKLGVDDDTIADSHNNLGVLYFKIERYDESIEEIEKAFKIYESYLSKNEAKIAHSQHQLANAFFAKGYSQEEKEEAEIYYQKSIKTYEKALKIYKILGKDYLIDRGAYL